VIREITMSDENGSTLVGGGKRICTSRYANKAAIVASGLRPVRISIGAPRWPVGYEIVGSLPSLMPTRPMLKMEIGPYREMYLARLEAHGVEKIVAELEALQTPEAPGLVLLCFEDLAKPGEWCHRTMLAEYLRDRAGLEVSELETLPTVRAPRRKKEPPPDLFAGLESEVCPTCDGAGRVAKVPANSVD
jgi:hypothetical protein